MKWKLVNLGVLVAAITMEAIVYSFHVPGALSCMVFAALGFVWSMSWDRGHS